MSKYPLYYLGDFIESVVRTVAIVVITVLTSYIGFTTMLNIKVISTCKDTGFDSAKLLMNWEMACIDDPTPPVKIWLTEN